jgi:Domain of unknown function DUF11/Putative Ig domain
MFGRASVVVVAVGVLGLAGALPASADGPVADLVGTLDGPASGSVGDVLTYTVTATNKGPDPGGAYVEFALESSHGLELVGSDPGCTLVSAAADQVGVGCEVTSLAVGATFQLRVQVRVTQLVETAVDALVTPRYVSDPDTTNNAKSFAFLAASAPPPPPPPPPPAPGPPGFSFVTSLPHATADRPYSFATVVVQAGKQGPATASLIDGSLPAGMRVQADASLYGVPYQAGSYTFTIQANDGITNHWNVQQAYTLVVDEVKDVYAGGSTDHPPATLVGTTILLAKRTNTSGCRRGPLPDRRCSPGAYYSKLTKKVVCASSFRTSKIRYVPDSVKHDVETEYGLTAKSYGSTLEIDAIVSLELGGSNDIANLYPERASPAPGFHVKDKLEAKLHDLVCAGSMTLRAAQIGIATNWRTLYKTVYGVTP